MGSNDNLLWGFSAAFVAVIACALAAPVLRRKNDVFTAWNFFLVGAIIFTGMSGINATITGHYFQSYRDSDYLLYFLGTIVFYTSAFLGYYKWKYPRRVAGRRLLRWPAQEGWVLLAITVTLSLMGICSRYPPPIPVVRELLFQFGTAAPVVAFACAFVAWYRAPSSPLTIGLLLAVGAWAVIITIGIGGSRRYLMSTMTVVPVALYWVWLRYKPTAYALTWLVVAAALAVPVLKGYSAIRHSIDRNPNATFGSRAVEVLKQLPKAIASGGSTEGFMGQDSVECAIMTIHMLNDKSDRLVVDPLFSIKYIVSNPIPRSIWPEKPIAFGLTLPEVSKLTHRGINANLGVNVAGQCYYDGGLWVHVLYGLLLGGFLRWYDELLVRQPGNPILVGGLTFMAPQLIGLPRGGLDVIGLQVILGAVFVVLISWTARAVFGAKVVYPRTDHVVDYPSMREPGDWARWMQSYTAPATQVRRRLDDQPEAA